MAAEFSVDIRVDAEPEGVALALAALLGDEAMEGRPAVRHWSVADANGSEWWIDAHDEGGAIVHSPELGPEDVARLRAVVSEMRRAGRVHYVQINLHFDEVDAALTELARRIQDAFA